MILFQTMVGLGGRQDMYMAREDLMTPEELEDYHHDPSIDDIPTMRPTLRQWLLIGADVGMTSGLQPWCKPRITGRDQIAL